MKRAFLFVAVVVVCLAQTTTPPVAPTTTPVAAISAYYLNVGQSVTDPLIASTPQYKWAHLNPPLIGTLDAANTLQLGVTLPASPRQCSFSLGDGISNLSAGQFPTINAFMGCPNNTSAQWTVTGIHCWSDNVGLSSTVDVLNNAGTSFMLMPLLCSAVQAGGGTVGVLANAPANLPASSANTALAPGDAFNFLFNSDGITMAFRVTVDYTQ